MDISNFQVRFYVCNKVGLSSSLGIRETVGET